MSETQHTVANLQNSLLFLQQEHARTLQDLQVEITALQKKCSDQTFQLTLHGLGQSDAAVDDSTIKKLEQELVDARGKFTETRAALEAKEKRVNFLEEQLRSREKRFQDDLKNASRRVGELELELDNRAANIAYLTTQLHQTKLVNAQQHHQKEKSTHVTVELQKSPPRQAKPHRTATPPPTVAAEHSYSPSPPQAQPPLKSGRRSQLRRSQTSPVATASVGGAISESGSSQQLPAAAEIGSVALSSKASTSGKPTARTAKLRDDDGPARPGIGLSQARRDRHGDLRLANSGVSLHQRRSNAAPPAPRPKDYEEMIRISQSTDKSAAKIQLAAHGSKPEPLPPITTRTGRQLRNNGVAAGRAAGGRKGHQQAAASGTTGEIEQLIIEPLAASPEKSFRQTAQNSTSK